MCYRKPDVFASYLSESLSGSCYVREQGLADGIIGDATFLRAPCKRFPDVDCVQTLPVTGYSLPMKLITGAVGAVGLLVCGGVVVLLAVTPLERWGLLPVTAAGAVVAACVAGVAALAATESVSSRRRHEADQAINERRKAVYDQVIAQMVSAFTGRSGSRDEAAVRASLSLWASADVVVEYRRFTEIINEIDLLNPERAGSTVKTIPAELQPKIQLQVGVVAAAMRADVMWREGRSSKASSEQIAEMIFNDYSSDSSK